MVLSYESLNSKQKAFFIEYLYNGLGSKELKVTLPEFIFRDAAIEHDFYSYSGGSHYDRIKSDKLFFKRCINTIKKKRKYIIYYPVAYIYYFGLLSLSHLTWDEYDRPAKDWEEFIKRVEAHFKSINKEIPWKPVNPLVL